MISDSDTAGAAPFLSRAEVSEAAQAILDEDSSRGRRGPASRYAALGSAR
jgi:hypothetical protein